MTTLFKITPECYSDFVEYDAYNIGKHSGSNFIRFTDMDMMPEHSTLMFNLLGTSSEGALKMIQLLVDETVEVVEVV